MFQSFASISDPSFGAKRISALREQLKLENLQGFLVPRADKYQGENVAPGDERLAWLTGFTGSAGTCCALHGKAAIFIDGRYVLAVRGMVDLSVFEPVQVPQGNVSEWLTAALPNGGDIGFDPWLHSVGDIAKLTGELTQHAIVLRPIDNLVDRIWHDRPAAPLGKIVPHPIEYAGETHQSKRERIAATLTRQGQSAFVITAPESIAWLLNIRGSDVARTPVAHVFAILGDDAKATLFVEPAKVGADLRAHLGSEIALRDPGDFATTLDRLQGKIGIDDRSTPYWVTDRLKSSNAANDPCVSAMVQKNQTELAGARSAHIRDGAAMANFLCWLSSDAPKGDQSEIDAVKRLEDFRRATGQLKDISFNTICGAGPNAAIIHYRVSETSNRTIKPGDVLWVDSGGQYLDGTTDITRSLAVGPVSPDAARVFTLVLKGMIAISRARWPVGLTGRDLDAFARQALWQAGLDYDHGTGHGVGSYLDVHEGPQGISRRTTTPLEAGMILSNEPGYYREGAFGVRIENLIVVEPATIPQGGDRPMHAFETLTLAPIDRRMIVPDLLDRSETDWLNAYHARVLAQIGPLVPAKTANWLRSACAALPR